MAKFSPLVFLAIALLSRGVFSTTFTFQNNCPYTIWPATLSGATSPPLSSTGFTLNPGSSQTLVAPPHWSGRIWARLQCSVDASGRFSCASADCGSGVVECNGAGGAPPASLVEVTLNGADGKDFYDVSLVDGFNLPVSIVPQTGSPCNSTGCRADVNLVCPPELQMRFDGGAVIGCRSACAALGGDQYCCSGQFSDPKTCRPTQYSLIFKNACPQAYSYAYDDATSTFTCTGADYIIVFCP